MAVTTLVATAGATDANAYVTSAVADQYHLDHPQFGTTALTGLWSAATADQKSAAILWATKLLDRLFVWKGTIAATTQRLGWPRAGLADVNEWNALDHLTIPEQIQWATAEFARQLLIADRTQDSDIEAQRITSIRAGSVALTFGAGVMAKQIPDAVKVLIPPHWGYPRGSGTRQLERA